MPNKRDRTPFGERLYEARTHAKLSQPQLAKAVAMAQSTIGELEYIGTGSSKTAQIAQACGVNPQWLAEGVGPMLQGPSSLSPELLEMALEIEAMPARQRDWVLLNLREAVKLVRETLTQSAVAQSSQKAERTPSIRRKRA